MSSSAAALMCWEEEGDAQPGKHQLFLQRHCGETAAISVERGKQNKKKKQQQRKTCFSSHFLHAKMLVFSVLLFLRFLGFSWMDTPQVWIFYAVFLSYYAFAEVLTSLRGDGSETMRRTVLKLQLIWMFYFIHELVPDLWSDNTQAAVRYL